jgi:antitoxin (DNA-binding transcriptional repressor) of toxin-antitoxin stability system
MGRKVTQRELRNESGAIMRGLDRGESYIVTRNGVPVGELKPVGRRSFATRESLGDLFKGAAAVDWPDFKRDVRGWFNDEGPEPDPSERGAVSQTGPPAES